MSEERTITTGQKITLRDLETGRLAAYTFVEGDPEPSQGRFSVTCPVAQAVLGHTVGERVAVRAPRGERHLEILTVA